MPNVSDINVKKPSEEEQQKAKNWPIWSKESSTFEWAYTQKETCLLLEGKVTVSDQTGSVNFGAGDFVEFPEGLECTWKITEPVRKHYTFG